MSVRLGVEWGPDRSNTRDIVGFTSTLLRAFSKRTVEIEAELEARGAGYESPALRMQADDEASLATRPAKDHTLTPSLLAGRWATEAAGVGLTVGRDLDRIVCSGETDLPAPSYNDIARALVDEDTGLCAHSPRFAEPDVVEHIAALSAGRLTLDEIRDVTARFLASEQVVRLMPSRTGSGWEPARWSTRAHRALEDQTLDLLDRLVARPGAAIVDETLTAAVAGVDQLGVDQRHAVDMLCCPGGGVRAVLAPAGHGKTAMIFAAAQAAVADGRPVVAVATTAKAVAELADTGLAASTIARLRLDLAHRPFTAGTIVILDEISQASTSDMHTVLTAVVGCPGAQLWVLGDPRQAPAVKAGGIATELEQRISAGAIPAATLTVNRRQLDPTDKAAVALLRAGNPVASQQVRTASGWEHEARTPAQARSAMADAVTADIVEHGAESTVALMVSHGQAEDLTDRIGHRLATAGLIDGPAVRGPGWTSERAYQAGDRILLHTRHGDRRSRLVNGTVATITAVDDHGLGIRTDGGDLARLPIGFVQGTRADGSPNVSHAWARTVDGAQGGTWDHAHLLGSAALDAYRGYTGQSRSRHPTHTWNTTAIDDGDHGGRLADQRTGPEQVAAALARIPDTTMAAPDDPWRLDRHLRNVIAAHHAVLDRQPPDRACELADATTGLTRAEIELTAAKDTVTDTAAQLDQLRTFAGLTRSGRTERGRLETELNTGQAAAIDAAGRLRAAQQRVERLSAEQAAHDEYGGTHRWRRDAISAAVDRLDAHWTDVSLACVGADQPLAFGIDPLRLAHRRLTRQIAALDATLPVDRETQRRTARTDVTTAVQKRHEAERTLAAAQARHNELSEKRWPRRDSNAIGRAADLLDRAHNGLDQARDRETATRARLAGLDGHQKARRQAVVVITPQRRQLTAAIERIDAALDCARPDRVLDVAGQPSPWHVELLGQVPTNPAAVAVWCHAANRLEAHLDYHPARGHAWQDLCHDLADTPDLCAVAEQYLRLDVPANHPHDWAQVASRAEELADQLSTERYRAIRGPELERGIGLDLGL
jgi:hypothetical protein